MGITREEHPLLGKHGEITVVIKRSDRPRTATQIIVYGVDVALVCIADHYLTQIDNDNWTERLEEGYLEAENEWLRNEIVHQLDKKVFNSLFQDATLVDIDHAARALFYQIA